MTPEEIDALKAGLEMDALIDRLVMDRLPPATWKTFRDDIPDYSTKIEAAWKVVEAVHQKANCVFHVIRGSFGRGEIYSNVPLRMSSPPPMPPYRAYCDHKSIDGWVVSSWAETAPLAICRNALKAVMQNATTD